MADLLGCHLCAFVSLYIHSRGIATSRQLENTRYHGRPATGNCGHVSRWHWPTPSPSELVPRGMPAVAAEDGGRAATIFGSRLAGPASTEAPLPTMKHCSEGTSTRVKIQSQEHTKIRSRKDQEKGQNKKEIETKTKNTTGHSTLHHKTISKVQIRYLTVAPNQFETE
ncbi:hypothetical protein JB92DRAFT_2835053 [Gautieria morchelliformis]|nr:hypothetical protein JB92DRAFT_2835053 [Gautieria morchelliformis]